MNTPRRLRKTRSDKKVAGVLGGIGDYAGIDPTLVRAGYAVFSLVTGIIPGVVAYAVMAVIMPD